MRPARSGWDPATPVSTTATTAPEPVLLACAASAWITSSPHCCGRSGSAAPNAAVATASSAISTTESTTGHLRMRRLSPDPGLSSQIECPPMNHPVGATWKLRRHARGRDTGALPQLRLPDLWASVLVAGERWAEGRQLLGAR